MAVRHLTGSAKIVNLLNDFGHFISHTVLLEYDTALAQMQLDAINMLPLGIEKKNFTTLVWDNIDFNEETLDGRCTHNTNGIIIQNNQSNIIDDNNKQTNKDFSKSGIKPEKEQFILLKQSFMTFML